LVKEWLHQAKVSSGRACRLRACCAISNPPHDHLLDAAYIVADADELLDQPVLANGLALSKIHHAAFDNHLDGPAARAEPKRDRGHDDSAAQRLEDGPDRDRLAARFEQFKRVA
jgi:putative restriction endonuclease